jgi:hypothetical protein
MNAPIFCQIIPSSWPSIDLDRITRPLEELGRTLGNVPYNLARTREDVTHSLDGINSRAHELAENVHHVGQTLDSIYQDVHWMVDHLWIVGAVLLALFLLWKIFPCGGRGDT